MIVLVPVSRFRITYEVTQGFPYSQLEKLVLKAVDGGVTSKDSLVATFNTHPRLLIESLMTLTHAGWIALGPSQDRQFVLTPEGEAALRQGEVPESVLVQSRHAYVLLERITGAVIPEGEARTVSKKVLKDKHLWDRCARLREEVLENRLDESQVHHLLPRTQGQRLHWVGPIEMVSKGEHYIPVEVDLDRASTVNLPQRCASRIEPYVIGQAREEAALRETEEVLSWEALTGKVRVGRAGRGPSAAIPNLMAQDWPISWSRDSLLRTPDEHARLLELALQQASTSILIASDVADVKLLDHLKPHIVEALNRGVDVDLLWGFEGGGGGLDWMKKLAYEAKVAETDGKLRFNKSPAGCNARMVIWDEGEEFKGTVGSYNWLADKRDENKEGASLSVMITHPAILSSLAWCVAGLWAAPRSESLSSVPDRWRRIATELESRICEVQCDKSVETRDYVTMRVVLDRDHPTLIREWPATAQARLLVVSESLDGAAAPRLASAHKAGRADEFVFRVTYGRTLSSEADEAGLQELVGETGGTLMCTPGEAANVVISDDSTCISGYSFLSRPYDETPRELGIVIEGTEPANQIADFFEM